LPTADMDAAEQQLWVTQVVTDNHTMPIAGATALSSTYSFGGAPLRADKHSSTEPSNLALLAYDERIITTWFPEPTSQPVSRSSPDASKLPHDRDRAESAPAKVESARFTSPMAAVYDWDRDHCPKFPPMPPARHVIPYIRYFARICSCF